MGILCVDVGRGTRDILYYEEGKRIENCLSLVLPSWSSLVESQIKSALEADEIPVLYGGNMGGFSLKKYSSYPQDILATCSAACTFSDDPARWEELGLKITDDIDSLEGNYRFIETRDVDIESLCRGLSEMGVHVELEGVAIALQDHGMAPRGVSDRKFRFQRYEEILDAGVSPYDCAWRSTDLPPYLTRMISTAERLGSQPDVLIMDSGMAAIAGALEDPVVFKAEKKIIVNVGNSHTLAAYLHQQRIMGVLEHHTGLLDGGTIGTLIEELAGGRVDGERIFEEGGHGAYLLDYPYPGLDGVDLISVTGPNRDLLASHNYHFAAPFANMMLTGAYGLLRAHRKRYRSC